MIFLIFINTVIFILLLFLHFYWALGGNWGMNGVIPTISEGQRLFKPGIAGTLAVGAVLALFAFITMGNTGIFDHYINKSFIYYATIAIGALFALRAIGDFRYIGFFRKATGTQFAKNDARYYSPLCTAVAIINFCIAFIN